MLTTRCQLRRNLNLSNTRSLVITTTLASCNFSTCTCTCFIILPFDSFCFDVVIIIRSRLILDHDNFTFNGPKSFFCKQVGPSITSNIQTHRHLHQKSKLSHLWENKLGDHYGSLPRKETRLN